MTMIRIVNIHALECVRLRKGWTRRQLCTHAGITTASYKKLWDLQGTRTSDKVLLKVLKVLELDPEELLSFAWIDDVSTSGLPWDAHIPPDRGQEGAMKRNRLCLRKRWSYWHIDGTVHDKRYRQSLGTTNRRHAQTLLDERIQDLITGGTVETRRRIEEVIEEYLWDYSQVIKGARSHDEDQRTLHRFKELLSVTYLDQLGPKHCQEYVARRKETVSNARINWAINALKAFFTRAHKWGWIPASPAADLPHLTEVKSRPARYLTEEEIGRLLEAVAGVDLERLVPLALNLGLRVGELCNLTWEDIDFQNQRLHATAMPDWQPKCYEERSLELNPPMLAW
jgi:DNA-binding Xre family transcriptional regulator